MKSKALIIFLFLLTTNCKAQNQKDMQEQFDIKKYNERQKVRGYEGYYLKDSTYIRQFGNDKSGYVEYIIPPKPQLMQTYKEYYTNGNLKVIGETFPNDFQKGIWREYDEDGKLIKETDYDKGFEFTWEQLLNILEERNVDIRDVNNTTIRKQNGNWRFDYIQDIYIYDVIIHGKTGEVLQDAKNVFQEGS